MPNRGLGDRVQALRKERGLTLAAFAKSLHTSASYIHEVEGGKSVPGGKFLLALKAAYPQVSADFILEGHDPPCKIDLSELPQPRVLFSSALAQQAATEAGVRTEDFRAVPLVEDAVAAGAARVVSDQIEGWAWVYAPLLGRRKNLVAVRVKGNSMDPVLPDGSVAVVDRDDRRVVRGGLYVVRLDGGCTVKYVSREGGDLVLIPENHAEHRESRIPAREGEAEPIVGRVVWSWRVWA
jgi:SOS-response transcriptional repressor LexA